MIIEQELTICRNSQSVSTPTEQVAAYFRDLAERGLGCTTNNKSIASRLGLTMGQVKSAKQILIATRRLTGNWGVWYAIDGLRFSVAVVDDLDALKTILRRRYTPVCDARVIDNPYAVPNGEATHLILGERRVTIDEAMKLAAAMEQA